MPHRLVVNIRTHTRKDPNVIYCGRGSNVQGFELGNKWSWLPNTKAEFLAIDRNDSIVKHRIWFLEQCEINPRFLAVIKSLRGSKLSCYCAPLSCHCDVIAEVANAE